MDSPLSLLVGGIPVIIYGLPTSPSPAGLSCLFMLHGRTFSSTSSTTLSWIEGLLTQTAVRKETAESEGKGEGVKDLIIVSFDHRNHGVRMQDVKKNLAWSDGNESHAVDMHAIYTGTTKDLSYLIDFLPSTLFPNDERTVDDWMVFGVSLGGHAAWSALAHEPRVTLGIPIIGSPSYLTLLSHRAATSTPPIAIAAPHFPKSLINYIEKNDPCNMPLSNFNGKKILVMSGKEDALVGYWDGASDKFVARLEEAGVQVEAWVQPGLGHACSPEMVSRASAFIWEQVLTSV